MKIRKSIIFTAVLLVLNSCTENNSITEDQFFLEESISGGTSNPKVCLDKAIYVEGEGTKSGKALLEEKLWDNGSILKIKFLGGSKSLQERVMNRAREWEDYANLKFEVVSSDNADIRIDFIQDGSSWSYLGTDAKLISSDLPTMNFGWFTDDTNDNEISRTTLHEFGHALGAVHEHQSPASEIEWDEEYVINYYEDNFGWEESQVRSNILSKYDQGFITNTKYDSNSIMQYAIDPRFTLNGFSTDWNYNLSDLDKEFIGDTYPFSNSSSSQNLASGKKVTQSSLHAELPGEASRAIDGNTSGKWSEGSVTRTATEANPWWQVELGSEYAIGDIEIWNRTDDCCASKLINFDVFVYNDVGEQVYKKTLTRVPSPNVIINAGGVKGSRVRVKLKGTDQLSLAEVEIYEYSSQNLASGKKVTQSSLHGELPGEASRAIDGNTSGKWSEGSVTRTATEANPWWQVELGSEYAIGNIEIWNRTDDCCASKLINFDVFVYNDAGEQVYKTTQTRVPSPNVIINAGGVRGSRVRVKLKGTDQLSLAEVEIYEH